ncbi:MAG: tRNA dimethylallyltransferase, partial [Eubacteriales bacterium]|nr:tRNA dimethylallyltransferase [Eubacteriales bacterium]
PNNVKRVIRALEILKARGSLPAEAIRVPRYHAAMVGLDLPRDELYRRIDDRVDAMINAGLEEEAAALSDRWGTGCTALQAIGYKEWMPDAQKLIPREDAIETIKRESRRYAKRQLTWFRNREKSIRWFRWDQYGHSGELMTAVIQYVKEELKWKI